MHLGQLHGRSRVAHTNPEHVMFEKKSEDSPIKIYDFSLSRFMGKENLSSRKGQVD